MSPWNIKNSVKKIEKFGNEQILLTDRGTFFGYNMLVNDFRSLAIMGKQVTQFVMMQLILFKCLHPWAIYQEGREIHSIFSSFCSCFRC